ncbi:MAG TPA: arabinose ABC transporter permease, partial [Verrucomicrobiales bacterium]|nr:arabinose ABC transporter permease [Verrucomicrobiales bacterium]
KPKRNYSLLLASQFLGAFGDNAILAVILGQLLFMKQQGVITEEAMRTGNAVYTSLLFVPYVVLAPLAGYLNDRFPKTGWLFGGNLLKVCGTAIAAVSIWHGHVWEGIGYFIVGIGACIYSPAKYGILPEIVPRERLVKANGTVELLTLVAILTGNIAGAQMIDRLPVLQCYIIVLCIYGTSMVLNLIMDRTPDHKDIRLDRSVGEFFRHSLALITSARLGRVLLGTGLFWVCGAVMKMNFQPWGEDVLQLNTNTRIALLGLWLSVGVMIGSVTAGQLYKVGDLHHTRWHGVWLAVFLVALGSLGELASGGTFSAPRVAIGMLILTGVAAGLFLIPLNAALQAESDQSKLGKTIACQNFVDNVGMMLGGGFVFLTIRLGISSSGVFIALAGLVVLVAGVLKFQRNSAPATA